MLIANKPMSKVRQNSILRQLNVALHRDSNSKPTEVANFHDTYSTLYDHW